MGSTQSTWGLSSKANSPHSPTTAMETIKVALVALCLASIAGAAMIDTEELKEAMEEAEDVDAALDVVRKDMREWGGGDFKKILKGMPPLKLTDMGGINLAGARDLMGKRITDNAVAASKELQSLAKAENRLAAAKEDVHESATAGSAVKRAQLEDLAQELTQEAVRHLEETKTE